jgi:uncharacterized membrane protein YdjX (TVP38/TMEM64 family)
MAIRIPQHARPAVALLVLVSLLGGAMAIRSALGIEWSVEGLRALVERLGVWAPIAFVLLVAFRAPLFLPSQLVLTVGGLCFGAGRGALYGGAGILLAGALAFGLTRWLGAEELRRRLPSGFRRTLEAAGRRGGAAIVALASGYPFGPVTFFHAAAALTSMRFVTFLAAAGVGSLARAATYAWFGSSLVEGRWLGSAAAAALLGAPLLPLLHPRVRAWVRSQFDADFQARS